MATDFTDRKFQYQREVRCRGQLVRGELPQGLVIGPTLRNVMFGNILRLLLPGEASIMGFADGIAMTIVANALEEITAIDKRTTNMVRRCLQSVDLNLVEEKTEAVLKISRKKLQKLPLKLEILGYSLKTP